MTSSLSRSGNQPKGRGRDVAWNGKVAGLWDLVAKYSDAATPVHRYSDQEIIKHHFQMIPSWGWLDNESHARNRPECAAVAYLPDLPRQYLHPFDEAAQ